VVRSKMSWGQISKWTFHPLKMGRGINLSKSASTCRISDPPMRNTKSSRTLPFCLACACSSPVSFAVGAALARANSAIGRKGRLHSLSIFSLQAR
jgi:hypothetical protein